MMMVGEREMKGEGGVDGEEKSPLCASNKHTTHTLLSSLLAVSVAGLTIVKPTGRRKLSSKWP